MENIMRLFERFCEDFGRESEVVSPYLMDESVLRFLFCRLIANKSPTLEKNFEEIQKVDLYFDNVLIEFKFDRRLLSGASRPLPMRFGKTINDFFKLLSLKSEKYEKYVIYVFDDLFINYLKNNKGGAFLSHNKENLSLFEINDDLTQTTLNQITEKYRSLKKVEFKIMSRKQIGGFFLYLYKIM